MATDESWSALRVDGTWHATYWICRVAAGRSQSRLPDALAALRGAADRVGRHGACARRARRQGGPCRPGGRRGRRRATGPGRLSCPSVRRRREAEGVLQREAELADGHAEYRFAGYVTVTAVDREELEAACVETEQVAQRAHLELCRLYGRQEEAFTWTLPLGRGLA